MNNKRPVLSICIPTYNGGEKLKLSLGLLTQLVSSYSEVELIVSDNCSEDGLTDDVLQSFKDSPIVKVHRNTENLGFWGNIKKIIDQYAKGIYCWIIGDDDIPDRDSVDKLLTVIKNYKPSYIAIRHRCLNIEEFKQLRIEENRKIDCSNCDYFTCLDTLASDSNVLGTFMATQVFLLDKIKHFDKELIGKNLWNDFRTTFPNSYMMTNIFHDDNNCCCINTPLLTAIIHPKTWDDKMYNVIMKILPDYYDFCIQLSHNKTVLSRTKALIDTNIAKRNRIEIRRHNFKRVDWKRVFTVSFVKSFIVKHK